MRGKNSRNLPDRTYLISFTGTKRPGRDVAHPPLSSAEVKERVELYFTTHTLAFNGLLYGTIYPFIRGVNVMFRKRGCYALISGLIRNQKPDNFVLMSV